MGYTRTMTRQQMEQRGWVFDPPRECQRCGAMIFWGENAQSGKRASFDVNSTTYHLKTCTNSAAAPNGTYPPPASSTHPQQPQGRTVQPPPPAQPLATATPASATRDLQAAVADLTSAINGLTAQLARRAPAPAAPARRYDENGCPQ
jgi:hypothetical protein